MFIIAIAMKNLKLRDISSVSHEKKSEKKKNENGVESHHIVDSFRNHAQNHIVLSYEIRGVKTYVIALDNFFVKYNKFVLIFFRSDVDESIRDGSYPSISIKRDASVRCC